MSHEATPPPAADPDKVPPAPASTEPTTGGTGSGPTPPTAGEPPLKELMSELLRAGGLESDLELDTRVPLHLSVLAVVEEPPAGGVAGESPGAAKAEGHPVPPLAIPEDPLARACLAAAAFMEGLNYSELARSVELISPAPPPQTPGPGGDDSRPPEPVRNGPRDLTGAMRLAGVRRICRQPGRATMELAHPEQRCELQRRLLEDHFGLVHAAHDALLESDLIFHGSPALRLGLARLSGSLAAEDHALGEASLAQLGNRLQESKAAAGTPEGADELWCRVRAHAELLTHWWVGHGLESLVGKHLEGFLPARNPDLLLGLLAGLGPVTKSVHAKWLFRVATEAGPEGRNLVEKELWWRLTQEPAAHAELWSALLGWSRGVARPESGPAAWARGLVRRLVVWHAIGAVRRPLTRRVLTAALDRHDTEAGEPGNRAAQIVSSLRSRGLAHQLALAVAADSFGRAPDDAPSPLSWTELRGHVILGDPAHYLPTSAAEDIPAGMEASVAVAVLAEIHARLDAFEPGGGRQLLDWLLDSPAAPRLQSRTFVRSVTDLCRELDTLGQNLARMQRQFESSEDVSAMDRACRSLRLHLKSAIALRLRFTPRAGETPTLP